MTSDTPAVLGKYPAAAAAPRALRSVMKLGELTRAMASVASWRATEARLNVARRSLVSDLRARGASWDSIGWLLGVTGEAVRTRYGDSGST